MNSLTRIIPTHGSRFDAGVVLPGDATEQPAKELRLPGGSRIALLVELPIAASASTRDELKILMGDVFAIEERIKKFAQARFAEWRADREKLHEKAKLAVRAQQAVLENLKKTLAEDSQDAIRAGNAHRVMGNEAHRVEQALQGLRFASKAEVAAAERAVVEAKRKLEATERKAGEWNQHLHGLQLVTIPGEQKKLRELVEAEMEIAAVLAGRDPILEKFGFVQR